MLTVYNTVLDSPTEAGLTQDGASHSAVTPHHTMPSAGHQTKSHSR